MPFEILYLIPKNLLSWCIGVLALTPIPVPLREPLYEWYARRYEVALDEVERPLKEYPHFQAFFTRSLKSGLRPLDEGVVSPVDGSLEQFGRLDQGTLVQAKGIEYSLADLVQSRELVERFTGGTYYTLYLAPGDYHHIHAPLEGEIRAAIYIPGSLWPVNQTSVARVRGLFAKNERIITLLEHEGAAIALVKVGATNVGSIRTVYNDFRANPFGQLFGFRPSNSSEWYAPGIPVKKGDRIASFYLGSTVVLLLDPSFELGAVTRGPQRYGRAFGAVRKSAAKEQAHG